MRTSADPSKHRRSVHVVLSVLWGVACFAYRYLAFRGFPNDHFMHLARAQQMLLGEWPIRDFFDPGLPLSYVLSAIPQSIFGQTLFVEVMLVFGCFALAAALTHLILVRWTGSLWLAGVLTLLQTFPEDTSVKAFQKRDRLYAVVIVEDAPSGVVCRRSQWEKLFALKGVPKLVTVPCEFTVGNSVTPAGAQ